MEQRRRKLNLKLDPSITSDKRVSIFQYSFKTFYSAKADSQT